MADICQSLSLRAASRARRCDGPGRIGGEAMGDGRIRVVVPFVVEQCSLTRVGEVVVLIVVVVSSAHLVQVVRAGVRRTAASRAFCTAGINIPMSTAMIAMTTSSSIRVKPRRPLRRARAVQLPHHEEILRERNRPHDGDVHRGDSWKGSSPSSTEPCTKPVKRQAARANRREMGERTRRTPPHGPGPWAAW